jgi:hypothetical protein
MANLRSVRILVVAPLVALVAIATACSDSPTSPAASTLAPTSYAAFAKGSKATTAQVDTFVYDGKARSFGFGNGHKVQFGIAAVCDPATSGYGPGMWDQPCTPAKSAIRFIVTSWNDADGRVQVSFSPDVRFVPSTVETLYLNDNPGQAKKADIFWCSPLLPTCINEALTDPSLKTTVSAGRVSRRIKHFSGYNVVFGLAGEEE